MLTRFFFFSMGLQIYKYRKEVEALWALPEPERNRELEMQLQISRPVNVTGERVTNLEELFNSPPQSKQALRQQTCQSGKRASGKFGRHTSGTTGEPTHISLRRSELGRMLAVRDYCFRHYDIRLGEREARLWGRSATDWKEKLKNFSMNRKVFYPHGQSANSEVIQLLKWKPDYLYGYASLLIEVASIVQRLNIAFEPPKCVVCTAETILPAQKNFLSEVFRAPVAEEYGATEFDIIAFECRNGHRHLVNPWLTVEENEGALQISDVSRASASIIQYSLGDIGEVKQSNCSLLGSPQYLRNIDGRSIFRFAYIDEFRKFHSVEFSYAINKYQKDNNDIFSFRVVQRSYSEFEIFVSPNIKSSSMELKSFIEKRLKERVGCSISVVVFNEENRDYNEKSYFVQKLAPHDEGGCWHGS